MMWESGQYVKIADNLKRNGSKKRMLEILNYA